MLSGVQQKNIVVTCNYEARKCGVKKLMSVKDAKETCPQLILVNGEDLTPYREMSYKVTALNLQDTTHVRLVIGSQVAEELREAVHTRLGLTGCAGVASNKLLAKLVSGTFKPNQQTVLLPESCQELIRGLSHIQKVPGIGYKTAKRLETLGVRNVCDLQAFPSAVLEKELGVSIAQRIQKLSYGEDDSPVTPSGPPQMVDVDLPFHLTLLSVCFSNLKDLPTSKKGSIGFYLKQMSPPSGSGKRVRTECFKEV
ncbi:hypothetical protein llap_19177 [Limosa lapponica baueri]|uniref:UmuC domain-containing protein n=1 Tax=Limosa lapponica baueri TaxID=1758121 RepID=A0A2I0T9N6_LIMLA|nr:hypothetical protein llap_19177 [Limosa lapponica baueri]